MISSKRPYLIVPKLIEQPTWGGDYILKLKNWNELAELKEKKIGQSYELFGRSKLLVDITDTDFNRFLPEFGTADGLGETSEFHLVEGKDYITLAHLERNMPLLIKINQAYGNSFQLHIKPGTAHPHWKPKPESWFYFEPGLVTFGLKKGINIEDYKRVCHEINDMMSRLSNQIKAGEKSFEDARKESAEFIAACDPHQYVNLHETQKDSIIDLSMGAIHHSWEEDRTRYPQGNVVYEVQQDVMDPLCTIRSFDQGKFKSDGSIRKIHIDDYFQYIDADPAHNDIANGARAREGNSILKTPYYSMDIIETDSQSSQTTGNSFAHLFVKEGSVEVNTDHGMVRVGTGHSCFLPHEAGFYKIKSMQGKAVVLKTYI